MEQQFKPIILGDNKANQWKMCDIKILKIFIREFGWPTYMFVRESFVNPLNVFWTICIYIKQKFIVFPFPQTIFLLQI